MNRGEQGQEQAQGAGLTLIRHIELLQAQNQALRQSNERLLEACKIAKTWLGHLQPGTECTALDKAIRP